MGTQLWAAVGGYSTLVRQLEFPADLVFYEIGISALNVLACCPPMRMKPTSWTSADFVQQTLITENSPSLAAKRKICPLEAIMYCIFLKHLIVLEVCCKGDLPFHLTLNRRLYRADSNLRNTGVNLWLFGGVTLDFSDKKQKQMAW